MGAHNGGMSAEPPAGSRAEPLISASGAKPPEAESFCFGTSDVSSKFASFSVFCKLSKPQGVTGSLSKTENIV